MTFTKGPCDENLVRCAGEPPAAQAAGQWVLAAAVIGSSIAFIDSTVVNVALPVIQAKMSASVSQAQWIVEAYALFLSSLILVGGSLGDRFGRRRVFLTGIVVFALSSAAGGLARTVGQLIAARAVQGIGGALLVPGSLALIAATFAGPKRGRAIGTWSGLTSASTALGPVLGGWLVQSVSWRAAFFLNVPIAIVLALIVLTRVPESRDTRSNPPDFLGSALATLGLAGIVFGSIELPGRGASDPTVWGSLIAGALALAAFVAVERRIRHPMIPPRLLRLRLFVGVNVLTFLLYAALSGAIFFLPFDLIQAQGYSPAAAGAALLPLTILLFALSRWSGGLVEKIGPRVPLIAGPAIGGVGLALLAVPGGREASYWTSVFPGIAVLGLGMAFTVAPLTATVMGAAGREQAGVTSGINNAVARMASLLAIAVMGIAALAAFNRALDRGLQSAGLSAVASQISHAERAKLGAAEPPAALPEGQRRVVAGVIADSVDAAFRVTALAAAGLALLGSLAAAGLVRPPGSSGHRASISDLI